MAELGRARPIVVAAIGVLLTANISVLSFDRADAERRIAQRVARTTTSMKPAPSGRLLFGKSDTLLGPPTMFTVDARGRQLTPSSRQPERTDQIVGPFRVFRNAAGIAMAWSDGSHEHQLARGLVGEPSVGRDGVVAFARRHGEADDIVLLTLSNRRERVLTSGTYRSLAWSHDGTRIAATGKDLWILRVENGKAAQLTRNSTESRPTQPVWSPDDSHIAFVWRGNIVVMGGDGSDVAIAHHPPTAAGRTEYVSLFGWERDNMAA
ncbi:MAG TPA: hypothetical protein VMZ22_11885 [Acidimicrobiales bacterium]|nr:hypothetical protein [Acidimicrobiales bacterium]